MVQVQPRSQLPWATSVTAAGAATAVAVGRPWWLPGVPVLVVPGAAAVSLALMAAMAVLVVTAEPVVMRRSGPVPVPVVRAVWAVMLSRSVMVVPAVPEAVAAMVRMVLLQPFPAVMAATALRVPLAVTAVPAAWAV